MVNVLESDVVSNIQLEMLVRSDLNGRSPQF